ncbi:lysozyme inhibitor LprI family protein [Delftia tsuruhatensis]|uniref:Lysozyme inhibitor LprI-like N-terminal domain-containing protein n=1 Tax=Delftia tsuruhatensis TaxID=180282 RepID=A0AAX3SU31_9BURK|nr:lysozyme inhibitor LprI family protein [Delftia tsuruhatensis]WFF83419.1 hypothetical protein PYR84_12195 [Delftia tsuruhatensis]
MTMGKMAAVAALSLLCGLPAMAAEDQFADIDCTKDQQSMIGMKVCAGRNLEATEKTLKTRKADYLRKANKTDHKQINKFFKAAEAYSDALCDLEGRKYAGGSMQSLVVGVCLDGQYQDQIKTIEGLMKSPEEQ